MGHAACAGSVNMGWLKCKLSFTQFERSKTGDERKPVLLRVWGCVVLSGFMGSVVFYVYYVF